MNIYNIKIWKGKEEGINFNACSLFTMIHNALVTPSNVEKMILMDKVIKNNENLKSSKEILDEKLYNKLKKMINYIDENINVFTHPHSFEKSLNSIMEIIEDMYKEFDVKSNNILIYGEKIKEISNEIIEKKNTLFYNDDNEIVSKSNKDMRLLNLDLSQIEPESLEVLIQKIIINYKLNYFWNYLLILEMIIINLNNILNKVNIKHNYHLKNSSFVYILLKSIFFYIRFSKSYYDYVKSLNETYQNNLIEIPDNYLETILFLDENILKMIKGNSCYCKTEVNLNNDANIKFNLLFSNLEIKLNLKNIFDSLENKTCNLSNSLKCKTENKSILNNKKNKNSIDTTVLPDSVRNLILSNINKRKNENSKRKFHTSSRINNTRKFHISTRTNNQLEIIKMKESDFINKDNSEKTYSKSLLNILEKIKYLTSKSYEKKDVQQLIEDHWTYLIKENYKGNIQKHIEYMNPKLYDVFLFRNMKSIKRVFNTIYIFFNDIVIYLIAYNVITTYFKRANTTRISNLVADHILIYIYKNYLIPHLFTESKNIKNIPQEFRDKFLINKFKDKFKSSEFYDLLDFLDKESLNTANNNIDLLIKSLSIRLFEDENYLNLNPNKIKYKDFVEEVCYYSVEKKNKNIITDKNELEFEIEKFKLHLGEWLISSFEERDIISPGWKLGSRNLSILELTDKEKNILKSNESNESLNIIEFNTKIIDRNINKIKYILANNLPMIAQPNKWSDDNFGGFLNNEYLEKSLITGIGINNLHEVKNLENLYDAINNSSSVKFSINTEVLDFVLKNKEKLFKDYYDNVSLSEVNDHILRDAVTLEVAKTYANIPFYLNTYADWRLRIYTHSFYMSYQGSQISLALLNFYEGEILTERGINYLRIYGANLYDENNISKAPYSKRIQWVLNNEDKILNLDLDFILKADSRFIFISFCLAYRRFKAGEKVYLPISLDATSSALQFFSALLLDEDLARAVNVIPNENEGVSDIYTDMLEPINENILNYVKNNPEYKNLGLLKLTRKAVKTPLMTITYSSTTHGRALQLASSFKKIEISKIKNLDQNILNSLKKDIIKLDENDIKFEDIQESNSFILEAKDGNEDVNYDHLKFLYEAPSKELNKPLYLTFKEIFKLAELIHESLFNSYPNLKNILDYFNSISKAFSSLDIPISWTPPSGAHITQKYLKVKKVKVDVSVGRGKRKKVVLNQKLNEMDNRAQILALNPNYIHSLDSSLVISLLSKNHNKLYPLVTIHDCFFVNPNKMLYLVETLQEEFINLFEKENLLEKFHNDLISILDKYNINYEIKNNNVVVHVNKSLDSDLAIIKKFNITSENIKKELKLNKNLTRDQLTLSAYQKKKIKDLSFLLPPKLGNLKLQEIKKSSYIIT